MQVLRIECLPDDPLAAAAVFYASLNPPRNGEVARSDGGVEASPDSAAPTDNSRPLGHAFGAPPPRNGEDLLVVFAPADHTHRAWRLAVVQGLARELAPRRVNALASRDEAAIAASLAYLESAEGLTGQYLPLDDAGAGPVVLPPA